MVYNALIDITKSFLHVETPQNHHVFLPCKVILYTLHAIMEKRAKPATLSIFSLKTSEKMSFNEICCKYDI